MTSFLTGKSPNQKPPVRSGFLTPLDRCLFVSFKLRLASLAAIMLLGGTAHAAAIAPSVSFLPCRKSVASG